MAKILDEGSDWKGRREQLIALKDQVKMLKAAQVGRGAWERRMQSSTKGTNDS